MEFTKKELNDFLIWLDDSNSQTLMLKYGADGSFVYQLANDAEYHDTVQDPVFPYSATLMKLTRDLAAELDEVILFSVPKLSTSLRQLLTKKQAAANQLS